MEGKGIWGETTQRVGRFWQVRAQLFAAEHPVLFFLAWGLKALLWNLPRALVRLIAAQDRRGDAENAGATVTSIQDAAKRRAA
jgi:hypothetical protein